MDIDELLELEEQQAFESQYADEMSMLNDMDAERPSDSQTSTGRRRLFHDDDKAECTSKKRMNDFDDDDFESDLLIDEELLSTSPVRKRSKVDGVLYAGKKPSMPTTLDDDRDLLLQRKEARRDITGSPAMIEKILRYRENRHSENFMENDVHDNNAMSNPLRLTKVLVYPPVHCDFMAATSTDGQRCYMRMRSTQKMFSTCSANSLLNNKKSLKLLQKSVSEMRQEIFEAREKEALSESRRITEDVRLQNNPSIVQSNTTIEDEDEGIYSEEESPTHGLWLDKFAPSQYTHLLSDESVNRSLLKWLKMWDHVVFGYEIPEKKERKQEIDTKFKKPAFQSTKELDERLDEYNRPMWKVALLCGPPGLGKTTLGHIIARHAGYHVVEMNASDDRSAETFKTKLDETTQMRSVLDADRRPNCLIIDEIDGAPLAAINVLLTTISKARDNDKNKTKKRKKGAGNGILLRPIICICNDLYVPSLRQLRQQSFVVHFPPTQSARLASRLVQLCRIQKLQCDMTTLLKLCEKTDNDIRSCINTLQFAKSSGRRLGLESVKSLELGQKDQHKNIFRVWQEIFQLPKCKRKMEKNAEAAQISSEVAAKKVGGLSTRLYTVHHLVSANGDYEKTFQGVYENFLKMRFKDHNMECINKAEEWVQFCDFISEMNHHLQEWSVLRYYPYMFVTFHMLFACVNVPRISFPTHKFENTKKLQKSQHLLESMYCEMIPAARCHVSTNTAVIDVIPYLLAIMTPTIRPVNAQLFSPVERKLVKDVVCTMLSYNLTYRQERNEEGQYSYVLEPNVAEVCEFEGSLAKTILPYSIKQMLSKEVEMERMRRSEHLMERVTIAEENKTKKGMKDPEVLKKDDGITPTKVKPTKNHLQSLENSISKLGLPKEKPVVNFFSRFKAVKKTKTMPDKADKPAFRDPGIGNSPIWYKFNEGFSNAVRQTVYVKDFL